MNVRNFLDETEENLVLEAIKKAETNTSGEIRVHLEKECKKDVLERAKEVFEKLKMHKTKLRNGVLFYVATESKHFAILGDRGINEKVESDFWNSTKEMVLQKMKEGQHTEALKIGIEQAGERLKKHFPYQKNDLNELSDEISTGK